MSSLQMLVNTFVLIIILHHVPTRSKRFSNPNILFILIDDLRHLSDKYVDLPHLKKLADNGVNFKNTFVQVCAVYCKYCKIISLRIELKDP